MVQRCNGAEARLREPPAGIEPATYKLLILALTQLTASRKVQKLGKTTISVTGSCRATPRAPIRVEGGPDGLAVDTEGELRAGVRAGRLWASSDWGRRRGKTVPVPPMGAAVYRRPVRRRMTKTMSTIPPRP